MARTRKRAAGAVVGTVAAALVVTLGGCGGGGDGDEPSPTAEPTQTGAGTRTGAGSPSPAPTGSPTATGPGAAQVRLRADDDLGRILTDAEGRTLYLFAADSSEESTCDDACAEAWPPLTVSGEPEAGQGARAGLLGTTQRRDGSRQVTYDGHPLYYFEADDEPGETEGQGLDQFGATWWALDGSGDRVEGGTDGGQEREREREREQEQEQDGYGY